MASTRTALDTLIAEGSPPELVVTLPPDRAGRHSDYVDVRPLCAPARIPVVEAADVNAPQVLDALAEARPDYIFVIGWSQICRRPFLQLPRHGAIGFHPSRLPQNRGRAVIPWTILQGVTQTGSSLFWLDEGVDTGDLLAQTTFTVGPRETATSLYATHLHALQALLREALPRLRRFEAPRVPQDHGAASFCAKRTDADGLIDWTTPAREVDRLVRASTDPYPGAFSWYADRRLRVWEADLVGPGPYWGLPGQVQAVQDGHALVQCGDREHVLLRTVQPEGGERIPAGKLLRLHDRVGFHGS